MTRPFRPVRPRRAAHSVRPTAALLACLAVLAGCSDDPSGPTEEIDLEGLPATTVQGDAVQLVLPAGVQPFAVEWSVNPLGGGTVDPLTGRFYGQAPGTVEVSGRFGSTRASGTTVVQERGVSVSFETVGHRGIGDEGVNDLWVHGQVAYLGVDSGADGLWSLRVFDVADPAAPVLVDSLSFDGFQGNDVKVRADGALAVVTHENSANNGITLLGLADPRHPTVLSTFTEEMSGGVHNVWIEGDAVYAAVNGSTPPSRGVKVVDVSDPSNPVLRDSFYGGASTVHDVSVRDGLAFVSHWDLGLVILDVGDGVVGGNPFSPREVSRINLGENTHNAWYWPEGGYVFVGQELGFVGYVWVLDVSDIETPRVVAAVEMPGQTPHNFWMDEDAGILYVAWYGHGIVAVDVTGELFGFLNLQGRVMASHGYAGPPCTGSSEPNRFGTEACTYAWGPQLHDGLLYVSDIETGLWVLRPVF